MQEYDVHEPESLDHAWRLHDWTGDEAQFAHKMLQHGDEARAWREVFDADKKQRLPRQTALRMAEKLLAEPYMHSYISFVRKKIRDKMQVTTERVLEELSFMAYANQADFVVISEDGEMHTDFSNLTREQMAAISEMTVDTYIDGKGDDAQRVKSVKVKLAPKTAALELLGKHLGMFKGEVPDPNADLSPKRIQIELVPRRVEEGDMD